jgi:hypothetical protein
MDPSQSNHSAQEILDKGSWQASETWEDHAASAIQDNDHGASLILCTNELRRYKNWTNI